MLWGIEMRVKFQAFGTFYKRNDYIYRKEAYLQFGDSSKSIGSTIMLNPGEAEFLNKSVVIGEKDVTGELKPDKTMKQLVNILQHSSSIPLNGRFHIYNLFSLQNTSSKDAVKQKEWLQAAHLNNAEIMNQFQKENHPWVLLAWSTEKNKNLEKLREAWLTLIKTMDIKVFGVRANGKQQFYHPNPRIMNYRERYFQQIVEQLKNDENIVV
jgi:hypothetical protein